jgi:hypothetical protein
MNLARLSAAAASLSMAAMTFASTALAADSLSLTPWTYDPGNLCDESATLTSSNTLNLSKPCPTSTEASAGATLNGVEGMSTTGLTLSFDVNGYCGAGAPRFNVYLSDGSTVFLGCIYGDPESDGSVSFTAGQTYGGVLFPEGATITGIDIVQDEQGSTTLSNVMVNGQQVLASTNTLKDQCKNGGWMSFTSDPGPFKNQGQCVSYFAKQQSI